MTTIQDVFTNLPPWLGWLGSAAAIVTFLTALVGLGRAVAQLRREVRDLAYNVKLSGRLVVAPESLAEHQLQAEQRVRVIEQPAPERSFLACEVLVANRGRSLVDILTCLVAAREVSNRGVPEIGLDGREAEWEDLPADNWNTPDDPHGVLVPGLSTTSSVFHARRHLVRLDPGEFDVLVRLDAVPHLSELRAHGPLHLLYKVFDVVVLAGDRPHTTQDHKRWRSIQYALFNLNSYAFHLALEGTQARPGEDLHAGDPLGWLSGATGWRCFLLHHWDFDELEGQAPPFAPSPYDDKRAELKPPKLLEVERELDVRFRLYDRDDPAALAAARTYCAEQLSLLVDAWRGLLATIERCSQPNVGWHHLIEQGEWKRRWQGLLFEEYLFAEPKLPDLPESPRLPWWRRLGWGRGALKGRSVLRVPDPVEFERFALRTRYLLATVHPNEAGERRPHESD
jgi:hypothetical protein